MKELPIKIGGILYRKDKGGNISYLLLKRTPHDGGFRQFLTGTVHDGELFVDCLRREIQEELGMVSGYAIQDQIDTFTWSTSDGILIHEFVYLVDIGQCNDPVLSPLEHDESIWLDYRHAYQTLFTENNKKSLTIASGLLETL